MIDPIDESSLIAAWARGEQRAFEEIFVRYRPLVRNLCKRWLHDIGDADEAVQETFLKACGGIGVVDEDCVLEAWLRRIARNVCIDQLRRRSRRPILIDCELGLHALHSAGPDEIVAGGDPRLQVALDNLAPHHRIAVQLRFLWGLSHKEIGSTLAKSPAQVKALLHRAKLRLLEEWDRAAATGLEAAPISRAISSAG